MDFEKAVHARKSVRKFSHKKVDWRDVIECVDAARYIPLAGKNFTMKFIIIKNKDKIQKIADAAEQSFITEAPYVVAVFSDKSRLTNMFDSRGERYSLQQAGAAIQTILLSAVDHGLSACWVGHYDDKAIKTLLKIPDKADLEAVIPIGYEYKKEKPREKINMDRILFFEENKNKKMHAPYSPET